jgi:hypothetical protein
MDNQKRSYAGEMTSLLQKNYIFVAFDAVAGGESVNLDVVDYYIIMPLFYISKRV